MKQVYRKGLLHHNYRFGIIQNIKVWFCRTLGHEINSNKDNEWCERCGMAYLEIYNKQKAIEDKLFAQFDLGLDTFDYEVSKKAYNELLEILPKNSVQRRIITMQLKKFPQERKNN